MKTTPARTHPPSKTMMIEQIMVLAGRSSADPKHYRKILESFESETLKRTLDAFTQLNELNSQN